MWSAWITIRAAPSREDGEIVVSSSKADCRGALRPSRCRGDGRLLIAPGPAEARTRYDRIWKGLDGAILNCWPTASVPPNSAEVGSVPCIHDWTAMQPVTARCRWRLLRHIPARRAASTDVLPDLRQSAHQLERCAWPIRPRAAAAAYMFARRVALARCMLRVRNIRHLGSSFTLVSRSVGAHRRAVAIRYSPVNRVVEEPRRAPIARCKAGPAGDCF